MKHVLHMVLMLNEYFMIVSLEKSQNNQINYILLFFSVCQKVIQHRYGFSTSTLSSNRSITPQQQSPIQILSNSHSIPPSSSYLPGNINLTQTAPASVFSSYHYDQQPPILSPPIQNFAVAQLAQCFNTQTINGVLKDRNNQQQTQIDKHTRSFKEQSGIKLSTLNETQSLPVHEGQGKIDSNEQLTPTSTPTQKRKDTKRKSNLFTVNFFFLMNKMIGKLIIIILAWKKRGRKK